ARGRRVGARGAYPDRASGPARHATGRRARGCRGSAAARRPRRRRGRAAGHRVCRGPAGAGCRRAGARRRRSAARGRPSVAPDRRAGACGRAARGRRAAAATRARDLGERPEGRVADGHARGHLRPPAHAARAGGLPCRGPALKPGLPARRPRAGRRAAPDSDPRGTRGIRVSAYFDSLNRRARVAVIRPVPAAPEPAPAPAAQPARRATAPEMAAGYRTLREKLLVAGKGGRLKTILFAGCEGGEGCTRVVREFADALASSGLNLLLVDADFRTAGLTTSTATQGADLITLVTSGHPLPAVDWGKGKLTVVPSPIGHPEKERFLNDPAMVDWLATQRERYDYVLLDAPPVLGA